MNYKWTKNIFKELKTDIILHKCSKHNRNWIQHVAKKQASQTIPKLRTTRTIFGDLRTTEARTGPVDTKNEWNFTSMLHTRFHYVVVRGNISSPHIYACEHLITHSQRETETKKGKEPNNWLHGLPNSWQIQILTSPPADTNQTSRSNDVNDKTAISILIICIRSKPPQEPAETVTG